jgi:hypothetical protein
MITELSASKALKPCPFCDGDARLYVLENENVPELEPIYYVACCDCRAEGPPRDNPFDAEKWWNREMVEVAIGDRDEDR